MLLPTRQGSRTARQSASGSTRAPTRTATARSSLFSTELLLCTRVALTSATRSIAALGSVGIPDSEDEDADGDGVPDNMQDTDGDGAPFTSDWELLNTNLYSFIQSI